MSDRTPVCGAAEINWLAPELDNNVPRTFGFAIERHLVDERDLNRSWEPGVPPSPTTMFFQRSTVGDAGGWLQIPALRGAIFKPMLLYDHADKYMTPVKGFTEEKKEWADLTLESKRNNPWVKSYEEVRGTRVALWAPTDIAAAEAAEENFLRTKLMEVPMRSFSLLYNLAPPEVDENGVAGVAGFNLYLGMRSGEPLYGFQFRFPNPDNPDTGWWLCYQYYRHPQTGLWTNRIISSFRNPGGGTETGSVAGWLDMLNIHVLPYGFCVVSSKTDSPWVIAPDQWAGQTWYGLRSGHMMLKVYGTRGWFLPGRCLYATNVDLTGPQQTYSPLFTLEGSVKVIGNIGNVYTDPPAKDAVVAMPGSGVIVDDEEARIAHLRVRMANLSPQETYRGRTGCTTTPVIHRIVELHSPVFPPLANPPFPVGLQKYADTLEITYEETGHGTTAKIEFRDVDQDLTVVSLGDDFATSTTGAYDQGVVSDLLKNGGIGKVTIRLKHIYGERDDLPPQLSEMVDVFTGYVSNVEMNRSEVQPRVTLSLVDRSALWTNGRTSLALCPQPVGWDFKEYTQTILNYALVPYDEIHYPDNYPLEWPIPSQYNGAEISLDPNGDLIAILDRLCQICGFRWSVGPDGDVYFDWRYDAVTAAPKFTLNADTVTDADEFGEPVIYQRALTDAVTHIYAEGRAPHGQTVNVLAHDSRAMTDKTYEYYVGRPLWQTILEPDNPTPMVSVWREFAESKQAQWTFSWRSLGKDLFPGDVVQNNHPDLPIPLGARFVIVSKRTSLDVSSNSEDHRWIDEFQCQLSEFQPMLGV